MPVGLIVSTAAFFFSLAVTAWVHSHHHLPLRADPAPPPSPDAAPWITVIVPARNEARNIRACVEALLQQTYPRIQWIVVEDRSTDSTPHILRELQRDRPGLLVVRGEPLPPGWAGKPHALHQGAQAARADAAWLCFLDADTFARPEMIASALAAAERSGADLFTMMTDQKLVTFWERVILPVVFTALSVGFSPRKVNDPTRPDAVANGQFLLFRRDAYQAIDGHRGVAGSIVEDRDLARRIKAAGLRLVVADGRALASTRMYTSLPEIWQGWTKNMYLGLADQPRLALLGVFGALLSMLGALGFPLWIAVTARWTARKGGAPAKIALSEALLAFLALARVRAQAARAFHIPAWYGLTLPLGAAVFAAMMVASTIAVLSGRGVTWKGRRYASRKPA